MLEQLRPRPVVRLHREVPCLPTSCSCLPLDVAEHPVEGAGRRKTLELHERGGGPDHRSLPADQHVVGAGPYVAEEASDPTQDVMGNGALAGRDLVDDAGEQVEAVGELGWCQGEPSRCNFPLVWSVRIRQQTAPSVVSSSTAGQPCPSMVRSLNSRTA